jgi:tight adherence protein C
MLSAIFCGLVLMGIFMSLMLRQIQRQDRLARRIRLVHRSAGQTTDVIEPSGPLLLRVIASLGTAIARSGLLSTGTIADLEETLVMAGFRRGHGLGLFVGSKLLLMTCLPMLTFPLLEQSGLSALLRHALDVAVRWMRKRHLRHLERGLPDALDLMVICTEAGLGLEPSISRVASEIRHAHPAVAEELAQTANELRITSDSRTALMNAGTRTGLDDVKRLATTLTQSMQYGTPLSHALRTLSTEMRHEMLTRFEARAGRLPVLLTLPMIVFILPCVFLVVGGPAVLQVIRLMSH